MHRSVVGAGMVRPVALVALLGCDVLGRAAAAEVGQKPAVNDAVIAEVLVSAERRPSSSQDVPVALAALSTEDLDRNSIESTMDLVRAVPSFFVSVNAPAAQPYIRGVGSDIVSTGTESSTAIQVDGVYLSRGSAAVQDLLDVDRVEVLKGPQGTLYGRNATAGVVNIVSKRPTSDFEFSGDVILGNYDKRRVRAVANLPISEDRLSARIGVIANERDGYTKNVSNSPEATRDLDDESYWGVKGALLWNVSDKVEFLLNANLREERSARTLGQKVNPNYVRPQVQFGGATIPEGDRVVSMDRPQDQHFDQSQVAGALTVDFGSMTAKSITAFTRTESLARTDVDSADSPLWDIYTTEIENSRSFQQEFQLTGAEVTNLEWVAGLYYFREKAYSGFVGNIDLAAIGLAPIAIGSTADNRVDAYAAYAQSTYWIRPHIGLTAGLRYSYEKKSMDLYEGGATITKSDSWAALTPKIGLQFEPNDDVLVYLSAARGFKSGGFNSVSAGTTVQPEYLWSYEAGVKSDLLDGTLRLNASAFRYDYKDIQVRKIVPASSGSVNVIDNAATSVINGFELETVYLANRVLELDASVSYLDATFEEYFTTNPDAPALGLQDLRGNRMPRAPRLSLNAGVTLSYDLSSGSITFRTDWQRRSRVYFSQFEDLRVTQPTYDLFNARLEYNANGGRWRVAGFINNMKDETYAHSVIFSSTQFGRLDFLGPPRTYGIELGVKF